MWFLRKEIKRIKKEEQIGFILLRRAEMKNMTKNSISYLLNDFSS